MSATQLQQLVDDGVVDEVSQLLKSGKEADVYLVRKGQEVLAAKVYKERTERNFKNRAGYQEGRAVRSSRDLRAMSRGSKYGRKKEEEAWKTAEVDALYKLSAAGVRVPRPEIFYEGVLLMGLVLDAQGYPAPRLSDMRLDPELAEATYLDLLRQAGIMLTCDLIHGDLSAFNVLMAAEGPTIIDLPQVITAAGNAQAEMFFRRDVQNLHRYLSQFSPSLARKPDGGADIWAHYRRRELFPGYLPDLNAVRDNSPVPTFKPRHANRKHDRRHGRAPEVVVLGAPKVGSAGPAPQNRPAQSPPRPTHRPPQPHPRAPGSGAAHPGPGSHSSGSPPHRPEAHPGHRAGHPGQRVGQDPSHRTPGAHGHGHGPNRHSGQGHPSSSHGGGHSGAGHVGHGGNSSGRPSTGGHSSGGHLNRGHKPGEGHSGQRPQGQRPPGHRHPRPY